MTNQAPVTWQEIKDKPDWVSIRDAAEQRRVHRNTIRNAIKSGKLPAYRLGARIIRIKQSDLDALFTQYEGGEFGLWRAL
jgi:excisionase family DNA binding protein